MPSMGGNDGFKIATRRTKVRHWKILPRNSGVDQNKLWRLWDCHYCPK